MHGQTKKAILVVELVFVLFLGGFIAGYSYSTGNSTAVDDRLSAAIDNNASLATELGYARGRIGELEKVIEHIGSTTSRLEQINAGFNNGIGELKESIHDGEVAVRGITNEHRKSGVLIGEFGSILARYSATSGESGNSP